MPLAARTLAAELEFLLPEGELSTARSTSIDGRHGARQADWRQDQALASHSAKPSQSSRPLLTTPGKPMPGQDFVHRQRRHERPGLGPRFRRDRRQERLLHAQRLVQAGDRAGQVRRDRQLRPGARRGLHVDRSARRRRRGAEGHAQPLGRYDRLDQRRFPQPLQPLGRQHVEPARPRAEPALRAHRVRPLHRAQPHRHLCAASKAAGSRAPHGDLHGHGADRRPAAGEPSKRLSAAP